MSYINVGSWGLRKRTDTQLGQPAVSVFTSILEAKRLELLHELVPHTTRNAVIIDSGFAAAEDQAREVETSARAVARQILVLNRHRSMHIHWRWLASDDGWLTGFGVAAGAFGRCGPPIPRRIGRAPKHIEEGRTINSAPALLFQGIEGGYAICGSTDFEVMLMFMGSET
jgi:hypothetical protein